jgi:hypothetical protein
MSTTKPRTDYPNLRQLLGTSFYKYTFDKDIADDEIQALKQFPVTNRQENFKRHQLLEELIETNMFTELTFMGKKWQDDIDLLALHKMKTFIKNTNK